MLRTYLHEQGAKVFTLIESSLSTLFEVFTSESTGQTCGVVPGDNSASARKC